MSYIARELERKFPKMNLVFKAILVTGARQVGKTTMLKHLARRYAGYNWYGRGTGKKSILS